MNLNDEIEKALRAWKKAANPDERASNRQVFPDVEDRKQARIRKLKQKYEELLDKKAWTERRI